MFWKADIWTHISNTALQLGYRCAGSDTTVRVKNRELSIGNNTPLTGRESVLLQRKISYKQSVQHISFFQLIPCTFSPPHSCPLSLRANRSCAHRMGIFTCFSTSAQLPYRNVSIQKYTAVQLGSHTSTLQLHQGTGIQKAHEKQSLASPHRGRAVSQTKMHTKR